MSDRPRIGLIGYGYIGQYIYEHLSTRPELGLDVGFVYNRTSDKLGELPTELILDNLDDFGSRSVDLVVELAHPDITRQHGRAFLQQTDYMPLSLTAFSDPALEAELVETSHSAGTRIFVPHGAVVGLEALEEGRERWSTVSMVMKKPVRSFDFSAAPQFDPATMTKETVLYDGPTRGLCPLFPRNVNSHAAAALAGIGFDRTRSVLVADPALDRSIIELEAEGDGVEVKIWRANPMQGVSGVMTLLSTLASIGRARAVQPGLRVC